MLTFHELKKKVPFAFASLRVLTRCVLKYRISTRLRWHEEHVVHIVVRTIILNMRGKKGQPHKQRGKSWTGCKHERRTKVNAAVLFTVHWVITPLVIPTKGIWLALARDRQQETRRAKKTAVLNMAMEEGGGKGPEYKKIRQEWTVVRYSSIRRTRYDKKYPPSDNEHFVCQSIYINSAFHRWHRPLHHM